MANIELRVEIIRIRMGMANDRTQCPEEDRTTQGTQRERNTNLTPKSREIKQINKDSIITK